MSIHHGYMTESGFDDCQTVCQASCQTSYETNWHETFEYTDVFGQKHDFLIPMKPRDNRTNVICLRCFIADTTLTLPDTCRRAEALFLGPCEGKLIPLYQLKWEMQKWRSR